MSRKSWEHLLFLEQQAQEGAVSKAPNEVTGLTGWWEAFDLSTLYTDAGITPVAADGNTVYRMTDKSGVAGNRYFEQTAVGERPLYKINRQNGKSGLLFDGSDDTLDTIALSNFVAAGAKAIILAAKIPAGWTVGDGLLQDVSGFFYLTLIAGNKIIIQNYSGGYQVTAGQPFVNNTAFVYSAWHSAGKIYDQINDGAASAGVTSGNTDGLASPLRLFENGGFIPGGDFYGMATYNQAISDEDRSAVNRYFMDQLGIE